MFKGWPLIQQRVFSCPSMAYYYWCLSVIFYLLVITEYSTPMPLANAGMFVVKRQLLLLI